MSIATTAVARKKLEQQCTDMG